jgi:hypothetical protein
VSLLVATSILPRRALATVSSLLGGFRVVLVNGPRQAGKSTLLGLLHESISGTMLTLDDRDVQRVARTDPGGFVTGFDHPMLIDEVQRGGDPLVIAIKADVDRHPNEPGRYVLAGSSRFLTVPNLTESLVGRAAIVELWPFSQGELDGGNDRLLDLLFGSTDDLRDSDVSALTRADVSDRIVQGGFPTVLAMPDARSRATWFDSYLETLLLRDLAAYRQPSRTLDLRRLTHLILGRTAQELVAANIADEMDITADTVRAYVALTETLFLHHLLPAWSVRHTARVVKRPKLHAVDTGLAAHVLNCSADSLCRPTSPHMGPLLETFAVNELARQQTWAETPARLFHYRDSARQEIDVVIEARDGRVAAVEVKAARDVDESDFRHLRALRDRLGERFTNGVVLHMGERPLPFGDRLTALPVAALWQA